jgi:hypothetical protein
MQDLISAAILIATLLGGTVAAEKIHNTVREAALTKAAHGLPSLSHFASELTKKKHSSRDSAKPTKTTDR